MLALFNGPIAAWSIVDIICLIIIVAGCVGIMFIVLRVMGIAIPPWLIQILWIVVAVVVAIVAIRFIASL